MSLHSGYDGGGARRCPAGGKPPPPLPPTGPGCIIEGGHGAWCGALASAPSTPPIMFLRPRSSAAPLRRAALVVAITVGSGTTRVASAKQSPAPVVESGASPARVPAAVYDDLRRRITRFQDDWRKLWEKARVDLDGRLDPAIVVANAPDDPRMRRLTALQCYLATPMSGPYAPGEVIARRPVVTIPDRGSICPMWFPPGGHEPSNEAESIDLALRLGDRRSARRLRDQLIGTLEAAHAKYPADDWIAGQRVRFVHDQGSPAQTLAAAEACRGTAGWCAMLVGLAHAQADQLVDAEGAFRLGEARGVPLLDSLSGGCTAQQALLLLPRGAREAVAGAACAPESSAIEQLWWLADPLWSVAGNERYVAHQSRRTLMALRSVLPRDERYVWEVAATGLSMRETIVRYGWPNYTFWPGGQYELRLASQLDFAALGPSAAETQVAEFALPPIGRPRRTASIGVGTPNPNVLGPRISRLPFTVKEYLVDQTALVPSPDVIRDPLRVQATDWTLTNPTLDAPDGWWPQEFVQLRRPLRLLSSGQLGFWRRDSTVRVAHIVELPPAVRTTVDSTRDLAFLAGGASPASTQLLARATLTTNDAMRFSGSVAPGPLVLSAELLMDAPRTPRYRSRFGANAGSTLREMADTELALSMPVLVRLPQRGVAPPTQLDDVIGQMATSEQLGRGELVALYWESYGFPTGEPFEIALQVRGENGRNVIQQLGALLGVTGERDSVSIRWTDANPTPLVDAEATQRAVTVHSVGLDLSPLEPGRYMVQIEMRTRANRWARSERRITIVAP